MRILLHSFIFISLAVIALWVGLSFPIHFRSISPLVLEEAAFGTATLGDITDDFLNRGEIGPPMLFNQVEPSLLDDPDRETRIVEILDQNPQFRFSGGPAPYFEQFIRLLDQDQKAEANTVAALFLPRENREELRAFLRNSSNTTVSRLLKTRELTGFVHFYPAISAAGQPLDSAILTTALLEQSGAFAPNLARHVRSVLAEVSGGKDKRRLIELEKIYIGILTLAHRTNWTQLTALLQKIDSPRSLEAITATIHRPDSSFAELYAALMLTDNAEALLGYLSAQPDAGWKTMSHALHLGAGALDEMTRFDQPIYEPSALIRNLPLEPNQELLKRFTQRNPGFALGLKTLALLAGGYLLVIAFGRLIVALARIPTPGAKFQPTVQAFNLISAVAISGFIWILAEPRLLEFDGREAENLRLDLASIASVPNLDSSTHFTNMIDQVTLIVLLMFFVLQLAVFVFCVLQVKNIRSQSLNPALKLKLLDNEDHLFDLGLYVGLGGTVGSLILVVMNVVQASLMAAYASTLFGILFVAILKVLILRPYRRRLILEATHSAS